MEPIIEELRRVTRERVEATPLLALAESAEMAPRGLAKYLAGASAPRSEALRPRLTSQHRGFPPSCESLFKWLRVVTAGFPPAAVECISGLETIISPMERRIHGAASAELLDVLIKAYHEADGDAPKWLTALRAGVDAYPLGAEADEALPPRRDWRLR
jgi:hypothetical protein